MRVEYLSDHGGQQLRLAEQRLHAAQTEVGDRSADEVRAAGALQAARRAKPLWRRVLSVSTQDEREALALSRQAQQQRWQAQFGAAQVAHEVQQKAAGVGGEDALAWALSGLSDEWLMLRGYHNRGGETDHVLVGPQGLWAIEVKLRPVRLHANGETWWYEKLDRYGNVVENGPAVDGRRRCWARQVSDVAEGLAAWLGRNKQPVPVRTAVMLLHPRAQIGRCDNLTIDLVATQPARLLEAMWHRPTPLAADACAQIAELIRRDHRHHERRRRERSEGSGPPRQQPRAADAP